MENRPKYRKSVSRWCGGNDIVSTIAVGTPDHVPRKFAERLLAFLEKSI
jgi:hypothetical protein